MRRFLILLLLIAIAGGIWWYFRAKNDQSVLPNKDDFTTFFPIGGERQFSELSNDNELDDPTTAPDTTPTKFSQITLQPVSGYTIFNRTKTSTTAVADPKQKPIVTTTVERVIRYVARSSGYVYEIVNDDAPLQISNVYIPNIYEANFVGNNRTVFLRFLRDDSKTIATYSVPIPEPNPDNSRTQYPGTYYPDNIKTLVVSPDSRQVAFLTENSNVGILWLSGLAGDFIREFFRHSFGDWLIEWRGQGNFYLQTKAASSVPGFLYKLDNTKRLKHITGNIAGLTTSVSPKEAYVLYSESANNSFNTKILNLSSGKSTPINAKILPEKCTWLKNDDLICAGNDSIQPASYPDSWYQGTLDFSDKIYRVYTAISGIDVMSEEAPEQFDMVNLRADEENRYLYFIDRRTGLLWRFSY